MSMQPCSKSCIGSAAPRVRKTRSSGRGGVDCAAGASDGRAIGGSPCMIRLLSTLRSWRRALASMPAHNPRVTLPAPLFWRWCMVAMRTPAKVASSESTAVPLGSDRSMSQTMTMVKRGSHVLMTCVNETERVMSDRFVVKVPPKKNAADVMMGRSHRPPGMRRQPIAFATMRQAAPALKCIVVRTKTSATSACERFMPRLKRTLATYHTATSTTSITLLIGKTTRDQAAGDRGFLVRYV